MAFTIAAGLRLMLMTYSRWLSKLTLSLLVACCWLPAATWAGPPAQGLPSALLMFPYVQADGVTDTRVEMVNLSGDPQTVNCFWVTGDLTCNEVGFIVTMTPYQPLSWLASEGLSDPTSGAAAPPFFGTGQLRCAVIPPRPELDFHNTIQGRITVFTSDGETVSYGAVAFRRLSAGDFDGLVSLDGITYEQCPDRLHFDALADTPSATSDLILAPCTLNLQTQVPATVTVQFLIINEFEQTFSTSMGVTCFSRRTFNTITDSLVRSTIGTDTLHMVVRGSNGALIGLVIDGVSLVGSFGTAGNEPSLQGGRSATVTFP